MEQKYASTIQTVRDNVSVSDSSNPLVSTGANLSRFTYAEVSIKLTGSSPTANVTPLLSDGPGTEYMEGETLSVSGAKKFVYVMQVNGNNDVNFRIDSLGGTSPVVTIKVRGL